MGWRPQAGPAAYGRSMLLYRVGAPLGAVLGPRPVAVAGTRDPTPEGAHLAREVGRRLAECGCSVVTGFARGVDESAAFGALEAGGRVAAVVPYLLEEGGGLNPRALRLLRAAAERGATASAVAENLVKDGRRVGAWLAARNRVIARFAAVLIVPEARYKLMHWGTRHAVEHALAAGRLVVVLKPRAKHGDVVGAFEHFRRRGAVAVKDVGEALGVVERYFSQLTGRFKDLWH
ncbi:MAG: DNA-processing protein DprA [Pyrobaculum sp.]